MLCWPIFGHFWCPVETLVTYSSNLSNFEKIPKIPKLSSPTRFRIKGGYPEHYEGQTEDGRTEIERTDKNEKKKTYLFV